MVLKLSRKKAVVNKDSGKISIYEGTECVRPNKVAGNLSGKRTEGMICLTHVIPFCLRVKGALVKLLPARENNLGTGELC